MEKFRHLDLFSGIGGFALAASWVWGEQHEIVSFCEIEPFPQKVLKKHWPAVPIHDDIKTLRGDNFGRIDLVSGGFPCQPYSVAGKQLGKEDDRALWPEMLRVIKEAKPYWVIGENVAGFISMGLDDCLSDLENEGYETTAFIIPACAVNAPHRRDRVWIIANRERNRFQGGLCCRPIIRTKALPIPKIWNEIPASFIACGYDGLPRTVVRTQHQSKGLGNAIVPQVVVPIMECIKQIEEMNYETV